MVLYGSVHQWERIYSDRDNSKCTIYDGNGIELTYSVSTNDYAYTKGGVKPQFKLTYNGLSLEEGRDYSVTYKANKAIGGQAQMILKGKGNFTGIIKEQFNIIQSDQDVHGNVSLEAKDKVEAMGKKNGWKQSFKLYDCDGKVLSKSDYDVSSVKYFTGTSSGNELNSDDFTQELLNNSPSQISSGSVVKITVRLKGNYKGVVEGYYRIIKKGHDISKATIKIRPQEYTGEEIKILNNTDFEKNVLKISGTDYRLLLNAEENNSANIVVVRYERNLKKGTAKVTFRGLGTSDLGGLKTVTFKINARSVTGENWMGVF